MEYLNVFGYHITHKKHMLLQPNVPSYNKINECWSIFCTNRDYRGFSCILLFHSFLFPGPHNLIIVLCNHKWQAGYVWKSFVFLGVRHALVLLRLSVVPSLFFLMPSRLCPVYGSLPFLMDLTEFGVWHIYQTKHHK